ncbi:MAG: hypothetical protein A2Z34_03385 [Planctomycetes bacterium RBG_16_59_8]|nr:MAG: hypothetical protein A2Z34_03385 [Planctomycetes bacterium RBG_16_59_8]
MRQLSLLFLAVVILVVCGAQPQASWTVEYDTQHYHVQARIPREKADELGNFMELVFKVYTALMNIKEAPANKFPLQIYADRNDYVNVGKAPPGSGAYYLPSEKRLVGYYDPKSMYSFFAHEGMHQFVDVAQPNFNDVAFKATWYSEGIADCIGNCEVINKKLYMCRKNGYIASIRLPVIQKAIAMNKHVPLAQFFALNKQQYYANPALCYSQGWSLCHFFMTYPKVEESSKQIPNGKYRLFLAYFHELLLSGENLAGATAAAMLKGNDDGPKPTKKELDASGITAASATKLKSLDGGKMPSIGDLEKEWKEYIVNFNKPPPEKEKKPSEAKPAQGK